MTKNQLDNILNFTLLFHKSNFTTYFLKSNMSYIREKWDLMIGIKPVPNDNEEQDDWQNVVLNDKNAVELKKKWYRTWSYDVCDLDYVEKKLNPDDERIINYLCRIEFQPLTPDCIIEVFKNYISDDLKLVESIPYIYLHPLALQFMNEFKTKFVREINLILLV